VSNASSSVSTLVLSLDIDGTMEFGEPPGPITVALVRELVDAGVVVGCASDRTRSDQQTTWDRYGLTLEFHGGKHHLHEVRARFGGAPRYVHVGDTHVDEHYAGLAGFEFVTVDDPDAALQALAALLKPVS
jgi:hypothetical protein